MMHFNPVVWAGRDRDRYLGPFTYTPPDAKHPYRSTGLVLGSGRGEDDGRGSPGARLRCEVYGHALHVRLPNFVCRPYRWRVTARGWDAATVARMGRDWYWRGDRREYGVTYTHEDGALHARYGRQSDDSTTGRSRVWWAPWRRWRITRTVLLGADCEEWLVVTPGFTPKEPRDWQYRMEREREAERLCPARYYMIRDVDGELMTCRVRLEQVTRRLGEGRWRWLGALRRPWVQRRLEVEYERERGQRKGSWKGGTLSCSAPCAHDATHRLALRVLLEPTGVEIVGAAPAWPGGVRPASDAAQSE